jgi:hypothetical protein
MLVQRCELAVFTCIGLCISYTPVFRLTPLNKSVTYLHVNMVHVLYFRTVL